jgi:ATP-dependent DNA ligase
MDGNMRLQGRSKSVNGGYLDKLDHVPHLMNFFNELPNGTCLLGEIYFPNNEGSSNVTTIMGCLTPKAIERQQKGDKLHYYIFDIWAWEGKSYMSKKCDERFDELNSCARAYPYEYVEWAQYYEGKELWEQLQVILANGGEGIVMTKKGTVPSPGKRTARKTLKVKKELSENIDCFFTGRGTAPTRLYTGKEIETWKYWQNMRTGAKIEGEMYKDYAEGVALEPITKPAFYNWAGSLEIGVLKNGEVYPIGFLSGLADEIKADPGAQKMKCIEVTAMEILPTGGIRHAKLERFRPDLAPTDCTYEKYMRVE